MNDNLPIIAGIISTCLFLLSEVPMLSKAFRTKDLASYSPGNIVMANVGNVVHSVYVFSMPVGPIWLLHSFYLVTTALMLIWYLRYQCRAPSSDRLSFQQLNHVASLLLTTREVEAMSEPEAVTILPSTPAHERVSTNTRKYPVSIPHAGHDLDPANP